MVLRRRTRHWSVRGDNVYVLQERKSSYNAHSGSTSSTTPDLWELRKQAILQIAKRRNGLIHIQDLAAECNVNIRLAAEWLKRLAGEDLVTAVAGQRNTVVYSVKEVRTHRN
ncbi:hypothetical protein [Paenibacillus aceris]|uniref:Ribosomal protein S25 n=1 Tax=Paenibacillus aceris TaxID=869555 RepID=A0ABS4I2T7_9BACL|nr:hypothetical protein [Paenibacillus aceris]MBP1965218.1 ribosomal protein S25 [Paenibacillus aceris]NHW33194.1 hypothetical protein [Paenibacillus aceris]